MNVLLITFSFPPAGGVGVLRALSLAKYLPEFDCRVDVLTARNAPAVGKDTSLLRQVPDAVTVHRTLTLDLPFFLRKFIKKVLSGRSPAIKAPSPSSGDAPARPSRLKQIVGNMLLPDPQVGWLPFAFPAARSIIKSRRVDVVLITVPPFSSVRLATQLRKVFPALPIVVDFRDEWLATTINLVSFNNNQKAREVAAKCEREAVRDATCVVAVTQAAQQELIGRYPVENPAKFAYIPNGFDREIVEPGPSHDAPGGRIVLTYIGTVYGSTDPTNFVEAVLSLPEEQRKRLGIRYIGHIESAAYRETLLRLGSTIELRGFMPQAEALQAMQTTDYLLLITHDRINVAAKFYDYLAGGKPIFAAVHPQGDVQKLLEDTGTGRWADVSDPSAIATLLMELLGAAEMKGEAPSRRPDRIAAFHRRAITEKYAALLKSLVKRSSAGGEIA